MALRNFSIALVIVSLGFVGLQALPVSASSVDDLQAQIARLMAQIQELTAQLNTLRGQAGTGVHPPGPMPPFKHRVCGILARNLAQGARGDDVRAMQEFLHDQGYLSANATGYFGTLTAQAVARWQASESVSAVGAFGPMSRERMKVWCGGGGGSLHAYPVRGDFPLAVYFWHVLGDRFPDGYSIDFGDGTTGALEIGCAVNPASGVNACPRGITASHTYAQNGTYAATLYKTTDLCPDTTDLSVPRCMAPVMREVVGKVQIHVGPIACTTEYKPVCGAKPIVCITTPCNPIPTTYGNRCEMNADGANFLYEGQCRDDYKNPADDPQCKTWTDGYTCGSHCHRDYAGGPPICGQFMCAVQQYGTPEKMLPQRPYCTAYFDNASNKPPVISSFSGPTVIAQNESGTWTINASDPENGSLSYSVRWGDEPVPMGLNAPSSAYDREFVQTTTFTHAYVMYGTFTISIIVRDSAGQEAKTSSTVKVGSDWYACTADAMQCPNGNWVGRTGPNCQFVCN